MPKMNDYMRCLRLHYCFHNEDEGVVKDKEEV